MFFILKQASSSTPKTFAQEKHKQKIKRGGATGISSGTPEYKITLSIALKLKRLLENKGIKVIMTRESNNVNISNSERAQIANKAKADLSVRIHADGNANSFVNGYSVFYPEKNLWTEEIYIESRRAAQLISNELSITGAKNNGITPRGDLTGFNWSKVTSVLVETGFLSNPNEDKLLNNDAYQEKIAQGIFNGIVEFLLKQ
ncbi:MAG: N-acetylmuramoyl-L-alanine amidase [Actinobacteria bacterium]|nr:N-acetylmuramoyl-L-alanine amidase [Actinomycetota bacterium]